MPTLELVEWVAQPHKSFVKACKIADKLAKQAVYNGRIMLEYVVVVESDKETYQMENGFIRCFQKTYEVLYKATPYLEDEDIPCFPKNITSVWWCDFNNVDDKIKDIHGKPYFDEYFDALQSQNKNEWGTEDIAWFADCLSAARFLKKEWANAMELVLTVQKNGKRINLSNQMFRFGNVLSAQCIATWHGKNNPTYYNWYVGGQMFLSYGDAVIYVLESKELNFDDITRTKKENATE